MSNMTKPSKIADQRAPGQPVPSRHFDVEFGALLGTRLCDGCNLRLGNEPRRMSEGRQYHPKCCPITMLDLLRKANPQGEIGYAHGGNNRDQPRVQEACNRGFVWFERSYIANEFEPRAQRRSIYRITDAGRRWLASSNVPH